MSSKNHEVDCTCTDCLPPPKKPNVSVGGQEQQRNKVYSYNERQEIGNRLLLGNNISDNERILILCRLIGWLTPTPTYDELWRKIEEYLSKYEKPQLPLFQQPTDTVLESLDNFTKKTLDTLDRT